MDPNPQLSIIVPVFNVDAYLGEALDSIISQSYRNFEIIAVNDGSTDSSGEILNRYSEKDRRLSVFHRKHEGLSVTRNFGLTKANGDYIYFFDSDDRLLQGALKKVLDLMIDTQGEICAFSGVCIDSKGNRNFEPKKYKKLQSGTPVSGDQLFIRMYEKHQYSPVVSMYLYEASFLKKHGMGFARGYIHEDEAFTVKALCLAERSVSISDVLYEHRIRKDSIMGSPRSLKNVKGWLRACTEILAFSESAETDHKAYLYMQYRANHLMNMAIELFEKLKKNEKIPKQSIWTFVDSNNYQPFGRSIKTRYYAPFIYRVFNRLYLMYSKITYKFAKEDKRLTVDS